MTAPEATALSESLKLEAQIHALEARTANATIYEIYRLCTGATGEPGNWSGAEPVRKIVTKLAQLKEQLAAVDASFERLAKAQEWRPISEAPKDKTLFLVTNAATPYDTMLMRGDTWAMLNAANTPKHLMPRLYTHFMLVPEPPAATEG